MATADKSYQYILYRKSYIKLCRRAIKVSVIPRASRTEASVLSRFEIPYACTVHVYIFGQGDLWDQEAFRQTVNFTNFMV